MIEQYLNNEYRKHIWEKSKDLVLKISTVLEIEKIVILGSFTTEKERPADVDFIVMVKLATDEDWSTDIQFVPSNKFGNETITDAKEWMKEKYGQNNYQIFELTVNEFKNLDENRTTK